MALILSIVLFLVMTKHQNIITNVASMPVPSDGEKVIPLDNLEELIKLSDSLLKPVLHWRDDGVHLYSVIDGNVRFEYALSDGTQNQERGTSQISQSNQS